MLEHRVHDMYDFVSVDLDACREAAPKTLQRVDISALNSIKREVFMFQGTCGALAEPGKGVQEAA